MSSHAIRWLNYICLLYRNHIYLRAKTTINLYGITGYPNSSVSGKAIFTFSVNSSKNSSCSFGENRYRNGVIDRKSAKNKKNITNKTYFSLSPTYF